VAKAYVKTIGTTLLDWTRIAAGEASATAAASVAGKMVARVHVSVGGEKSLQANAWSLIAAIDVSPSDSGDDWVEAITWDYRAFAVTTDRVSEMTASVSAGSSVVNITSWNGAMQPGDLVFLADVDGSTIYACEMKRVKSASTSDTTFSEPTVNAYDHTRSECYLTASAWDLSAEIPLDGVKRLRVRLLNAEVARDVFLRVLLSTLDAIG
jgi:hypothetical protein